NVETIDHILFACAFSQAAIKGVLPCVKLTALWTAWRGWMMHVTKGKTPLAKLRWVCLAAVVYFLWQERNSKVFKAQVATPVA
ncbi:hypothetical protein Dimus_013030, partial [Dionaea muscipula]